MKKGEEECPQGKREVEEGSASNRTRRAKMNFDSLSLKVVSFYV